MTSEPRQPARKRILIVDDHPMLRRGLAALIETEPDLTVCGEAASHQAALRIINSTHPDLVIVDLELQGSYGLDLIKDMKRRYPEIPALVLSLHNEADYGERALRAGAQGYLTKQQLDATILVAIRELLNNQMYMSDELKERLAQKYVGGQSLETDSPLQALTNRELQVFRLIGQGRSTRQIADALHLSIKTIESHREHVKQKLAIESSSMLAQRATQWVESDLGT